MHEINSFSDFGFNETINEAIDSMGFKTPTPIQKQAIPIVLAGSDLIACAQTGTGKTGAFLLPLINQLSNQAEVAGVKALIVVPTRELALQIDQQLEAMAYFTHISSLAIYGGGDGSGFDVQKKALTSGVDVVVATPGKLLSHLNLGYVNLSNLSFFVLDEADRMLDMGFIDDIIRIAKFLPAKRQNLMFSATMAPNIRKLAKNILVNPKELSLAIAKPAAGIKQEVYHVHEDEKVNLLKHVLDANPSYTRIVVFASTKTVVKYISFRLQADRYAAKSIHSDKEQPERESILLDFKQGKLRILIATDVISRGIDIENINLVVNYNVPDDAADYVHRIGRTARAENKGQAITFINGKEHRKFQRIEQLIERQVEIMPLPEGFKTGPEKSDRADDEKSNRHKKPFKKKNFSNKKHHGGKPSAGKKTQ
ncbi:MAG TPA: DEAD/DEAH box helicase [Luteibaculaceae bacterium]|nr:DEAD/DEAH box helicase [Luteibaculaceae bacterium]